MFDAISIPFGSKMLFNTVKLKPGVQMEDVELALGEMKQRAVALGANAVIAVDLDYEVLGSNNGMLMVSASGTAVVVE